MNIGIKHKLFLVITIICAIVASGMFILMQWSFDRGFLNYVNKTEVSLFENVHAEISETYGLHGSWEFIEDDPEIWHELVLNSLPDDYRFGQDRPPPRGRRGPPPRRLRDGKRGRGFDDEPPPVEPNHVLRRLKLYDSDKELLIGPRGLVRTFTTQTTKAIEYQGITVGYLELEPRKILSDTNELQFSEQQSDTFALIALGSFLLAGLLAIPLANHFVKPITKLKKSTRVLASGEYKTRIEKPSNDELGELSNDFNILAETLEKNEIARQRWIADISHELRTPIAILRGEIEAIIDGIRQADDKSIDSLHQEVLQLNRLVDDLYELSLSDLGALNYRKSEIDICEALNSVIENFEESFRQKNIQLKSNISQHKSILFNGDPDRLHQLFSNLLKNSLRYTNPEGLLEIDIQVSANQLAINFKDSAPGVLTEDLPKLFDRLFRAESSRNRTTGGAGLGMAIVKNIVEAHQGTVSALNSPLGGLWIMIDFPLNNIKG